ncbi:MAG: HlyD family efflux transporter periplasmic adaptor subunit [Pseudomonadota bacterium]|nr:HlyD family efflux transporter periplasmic adaptor subunit [Pseudomonadota bacterium]
MNTGRDSNEFSALRDTSAQDRPIVRDRRNKRLVYAVLAVTGVIMGVAAMLIPWHRYSGSGAATIERSRITLATVRRGHYERDIAADGRVISTVSPTLYASAAGNVTLKVHAGDTVVKGQLLALVDAPELAAKLAQENSALEVMRIDLQRADLDAQERLAQLRDALDQAEVDQKTAERESQRSFKAFEQGAYSELQALKARDALEKSQFALDQSRKKYESQPALNRFDVDSKRALLKRQGYAVAELARQVDGLNVRAPIDGQVGQVRVADRTNVVKESPLLTVVDLSALEVEIRVAESLARDMHPSMSADLESNDGQWEGIVSGVSPEVVNREVTARVRFGKGRPAGLRQNQRMSVRIILDRRDGVLVVDRGPFMDQSGSGFAYVLRGNALERQAVTFGTSGSTKVEVLAGLIEGDQIAISGANEFNGAARVNLN